MNDNYREIWFLLHQVRDIVYLSRKKELAEYDISPREAAVLLFIDYNGKRTIPADISRGLLRKPHSITGMVNRMEHKGLLKRVKDLEKKNLVRVAITDKGKKALQSLNSSNSVRNIMSCLSEEERLVLRSCLEKLRTSALKHSDTNIELPFP